MKVFFLHFIVVLSKTVLRQALLKKGQKGFSDTINKISGPRDIVLYDQRKKGVD